MRLIVLLLLLAPLAGAQPATVYEEPDIPPQAMDFDAENNRFRAHSGWIDDKLIHYYKFRMYVPPNYGTNDGGLDKVPIQPLYLPSTDGTFAGVPDGAYPILQFHTADGTDYSDFVEIQFFEVPEGYANEYTAYEDIASMDMQATGIIANIPVVPTGSVLEDPTAPGTDLDLVLPWHAYYGGDMVQLFVFESTSQDFADFINPITRTIDGQTGGWESSVSQFATTSGVSAIPIWHVNQYQTGVTAGLNNGGPSGIGQRNTIDADREDAGYSPLWQVWWATQVPVGYTADQASNADQFNEENGFKIAKTPMYVNCPNLGPHGGTTVNSAKASSFDTMPAVGAARLEGSIPMQEGVELDVLVDGEKVGTTTTGMMGLFTYDLAADNAGETVSFVRVDDGTEVASWSFAPADNGAPGPAIALISAALLLVAFARRRM